MRIEKIVGINGLTLIVYYTPADCWQFAVVGKDGQLWQPDDIFSTSEKAESEGRKWINALLG
ncbi:MAG: hypothetical protein ACRDEA_19055 [Microcystaceae cyanobacterium]